MKARFAGIILILGLLATICQADIDTIKRLVNRKLRSYKNNKNLSAMNRIPTYGTPPSYRNIGNDATGILSEYGCWCNFQREFIKGKAKPVDKIDEICKVMQNGYECVSIDTEDECFPWKVSYIPGINKGLENLEQTCTSVNEGTCAQFEVGKRYLRKHASQDASHKTPSYDALDTRFAKNFS